MRRTADQLTRLRTETAPALLQELPGLRAANSTVLTGRLRS
ncbi:hypothetical protein ACWEPB_12035 [Kitasatospora cineracea]